MEQIVFPVPTICEYLTKETKQRIFLTTEKDEQNSKITGFFEAVDSMWNEMKWQRKLRQQTWLYWFSSHMSLWSDITFNFAVLINMLVAIFYPFDRGITGTCSRLSHNYKTIFCFNFIHHLFSLFPQNWIQRLAP
jgi:hypothetical protein